MRRRGGGWRELADSKTVALPPAVASAQGRRRGEGGAREGAQEEPAPAEASSMEVTGTSWTSCFSMEIVTAPEVVSMGRRWPSGRRFHW